MKIQTKDLSTILTKEFLIKEYILNKKSTIIIGKEVGCNNASVSNYLIKYEIKRRTFKEASSGELNGMFGTHRKGVDNPNFKTGRYARSNCYCTVCGKKVTRVGKCQRCSWNARHKVKYCVTCDASIDVRAIHCKKCQLENTPSGKNHHAYKGGKPQCTECGVVKKTYPKGKCKVCANTGKLNPNWNGGSSFEPYTSEFNPALKRKIRVRDNYTCQKCGIKQENHYRKLDVHHIDYDKQNCEEENLITLCNSCNAKVNSNRSSWTKYFNKKLV